MHDGVGLGGIDEVEAGELVRSHQVSRSESGIHNGRLRTKLAFLPAVPEIRPLRRLCPYAPLLPLRQVRVRVERDRRAVMLDEVLHDDAVGAVSRRCAGVDRGGRTVLLVPLGIDTYILQRGRNGRIVDLTAMTRGLEDNFSVDAVLSILVGRAALDDVDSVNLGRHRVTRRDCSDSSRRQASQYRHRHTGSNTKNERNGAHGSRSLRTSREKHRLAGHVEGRSHNFSLNRDCLPSPHWALGPPGPLGE